ncbi:ornithine cyclodeaminase [Grimontia sp. NTOU-MAR1]|uniref:ornithine cyclodeaminase n=1 Tax=Grimontia sp. NTOU-MAR1 TaxID=3111011 RepID=UPI002DB8192E|nr:ornithine cyclodeaminase [Grimontia sp. NTOU-MAR1]WRW00999.1 ornithine cyclodeaminase [Grimontia sp. NTOU-MAR1]
MTRFIDVDSLSSLIKVIGIKNFFLGLGDKIREDFLRWNEFEKSARTANHCNIGVIELMPISDVNEFGFKYVNGHPGNPKVGLSTVMAFGTFSSMKTGYPLLVSELTITTAFRTAVMSAIAASYLVRDDSERMAIIGCGAQAEFQILAFYFFLGIKKVDIYDVDELAMEKLLLNLKDYTEIEITKYSSIKETVKGCDIVTTVTADKKWATILDMDMIESGMHINAVGGDCPGKTELDIEILKRSSVFVEYEPQTRIEGEIQQLSDDFEVTELWEVISNKREGRSNKEQITIFDSVGFALEDYSSLRYLFELSNKFNIGDTINLIPDLADPKNLFVGIKESYLSETITQAS